VNFFEKKLKTITNGAIENQNGAIAEINCSNSQTMKMALQLMMIGKTAKIQLEVGQKVT
jgi:hypothetical protein